MMVSLRPWRLATDAQITQIFRIYFLAVEPHIDRRLYNQGKKISII